MFGSQRTDSRVTCFNLCSEDNVCSSVDPNHHKIQYVLLCRYMWLWAWWLAICDTAHLIALSPGCRPLRNTIFLNLPYFTLVLYYCTKLNIVGVDAFLKLSVAIASMPNLMYRLIPVEYLQPWRGFFAGITSPEFKALLLSAKVGGQGTILRMWCSEVEQV